MRRRKKDKNKKTKRWIKKYKATTNYIIDFFFTIFSLMIF